MLAQYASSLTGLRSPPTTHSTAKSFITRNLDIQVKDPFDRVAPATLHEPRIYDPHVARNSAVILISGAGGGASGPAGIYPSVADKLASRLHIPCIRLDYERPARRQFCIPDILASMSYLSLHYNTSRFVLIGWSFGGAPCLSVSAREPQRIMGVATVASQSAETDGIKKLAPRPLLLVHGTADACLSPRCAHYLYRAYGEYGNRELRLFEGDGHGLTRNASEVERLLVRFSARCLGLELEMDEGKEIYYDCTDGEKEGARRAQRGKGLYLEG